MKTAQFDQECIAMALSPTLPSADSSGSDPSNGESMWSRVTNSTATTVENDPHGPSNIEARDYYAGLRSNGHGPRLVYRDSSDVYEEPTGPEAYKRLMRLITVPEDHEFGKEGLWDKVRDEVGPLFAMQ